MKNLSQLMAEFRGGYQHSSRYRVCIFPPKEMLTRMIPKLATFNPDGGFRGALEAVGDIAEKQISLPLAAQWLARGLVVATAHTPSRAIEMFEHRMYGVTEQIAYNSEYIPLEMTVRLPLITGDSVIPRFLNFWQNMIHNQYKGMESGADLGFPEDYYGSVILGMFDQKNNPTLIYKFEKAFPSTVGSTAVAWENSNSLVHLPLTFQYSNFHILSRSSPEALTFIGAQIIGQ